MSQDRVAENPNHFELERKYDAKKVSPEAFLRWGIKYDPKEYLRVTCPDMYYKARNGGVIRHRWADFADNDSKGPGQLTSKRRVSKDNIEKRAEVDLEFGHRMTREDVIQFIHLAGCKMALGIMKTSRIFIIDYATCTGKAKITVALYTVEPIANRKGMLPGKARTFLEVEVEKSNRMSSKDASKVLAQFEKELTKEFDLGPVEKLSLYELYTGKKYALVD